MSLGWGVREGFVEDGAHGLSARSGKVLTR